MYIYICMYIYIYISLSISNYLFIFFLSLYVYRSFQNSRMEQLIIEDKTYKRSVKVGKAWRWNEMGMS